MKQIVVGIFAAALVSVTFGHAQSSRPAFEVASIKRNTSAEGNTRIADQPGGRFIASRTALRRLIQFAYRGNQEFLGGPDWIDSDRWDIQAKAAEGEVPLRTGLPDLSVPDTIALMVQSLLEDRFKLKVHTETRQLPVYELLVTKGGPKIKLSEDQTPPSGLLAAGGAQGTAIPRGAMRMGRSDLEVQAISIENFAKALGVLYAGRQVIDKTGLQGLYDIKLQWAPDPGLPNPAGPGPIASAPADQLGPSLFTALQEQLGLRLESTRGPVQVLVIDHVERPSEN